MSSRALTIHHSSLLMLIITVNHATCLRCNFSSEYHDVGWYINPITVDAYSYFVYGTQIKYWFNEMEASYDCTELLDNNGFSFSLYEFGIQKRCEKLILANDKSALLVSTVRNETASTATDCQAMFTDSCYVNTTCTAAWRPKVLSPFNGSLFASPGVPCPLPAGVYAAATQLCNATVTVSSTEMLFGSCTPVPTNDSLNQLTNKGLKLYAGLKLTCMGAVSGNSLNPTETADVVLLASDTLSDSFCARYSNTSANNGVSTLIFDVTDNGGIISCGVQGSITNIFISMNITTEASPATAKTVSTSSVTNTAQLSNGVSASDAATTLDHTDHTGVTAITTVSSSAGTIADCATVQCPAGLVCDASNSNATCVRNASDDSSIKVVIIGVSVGVTVLTAAGILIWCCVRAAKLPPSSTKDAATPRIYAAQNTAGQFVYACHGVRKTWVGQGHPPSFNYAGYPTYRPSAGHHHCYVNIRHYRA